MATVADAGGGPAGPPDDLGVLVELRVRGAGGEVAPVAESLGEAVARPEELLRVAAPEAPRAPRALR